MGRLLYPLWLHVFCLSAGPHQVSSSLILYTTYKDGATSSSYLFNFLGIILLKSNVWAKNIYGTLGTTRKLGDPVSEIPSGSAICTFLNIIIGVLQVPLLQY